MARPHLPFDALLIASGCDTATIRCSSRKVADWRGADRTGSYDRPAPITIFAELIGIDRRTVLRWAHGGVPLTAAEDACDVLGIHPCEVWHGDYLNAVLGEPDESDDELRRTASEEARAEREWAWARLRRVLAEVA